MYGSENNAIDESGNYCYEFMISGDDYGWSDVMLLSLHDAAHRLMCMSDECSC